MRILSRELSTEAAVAVTLRSFSFIQSGVLQIPTDCPLPTGGARMAFDLR